MTKTMNDYLRFLLVVTMVATLWIPDVVIATRSISMVGEPNSVALVRTTQTERGLFPEAGPNTNNTTTTSEAIVTEIPPGGIKVPRVVPSLISRKASITMGSILALNSGLINGCALSGAITADGSSHAVTAITASWTNSALGLASKNMVQFYFLCQLLLSFVSGSLLTGLMQPYPFPFLVSSTCYGLPLSIAGVATALAKRCLDHSSSVKTGFLLLAMASGINNSVTSTMTSNLCRTSHLTGISSDMGTFLGQLLRGNKANAFKLKVFAGLAASFWVGGYLSYALSKEYGSNVLYASAAIYLSLATLYEKLAKAIL